MLATRQVAAGRESSLLFNASLQLLGLFACDIFEHPVNNVLGFEIILTIRQSKQQHCIWFYLVLSLYYVHNHSMKYLALSLYYVHNHSIKYGTVEEDMGHCVGWMELHIMNTGIY